MKHQRGDAMVTMLLVFTMGFSICFFFWKSLKSHLQHKADAAELRDCRNATQKDVK